MPEEFKTGVIVEVNGEVYENKYMVHGCREEWIHYISTFMFQVDPLKLPEQMQATTFLFLDDDNEEVLAKLVDELINKWSLRVNVVFQEVESTSVFVPTQRAMILSSTNFDSVTLMWWMILLRRLASNYVGSTAYDLIKKSSIYNGSTWYLPSDKEKHLELLESFHPKLYAEYWLAARQRGLSIKGPISYKSALQNGFFKEWQ